MSNRHSSKAPKGQVSTPPRPAGIKPQPPRRGSKAKLAAVVVDAPVAAAAPEISLPAPQALPRDLVPSGAQSSSSGGALSGPQALPSNVRTLGPYEVVAPLDMGGTAEVLLGLRQTVEGYCQSVAIKALRAEYKLDPVVRHMFFAEARLGATLIHPNIPHTLDLGEHQGIPYVVSEYLAGKPLHRVLDRAVERRLPISLRAVFTIALEVLEALAYVHSVADFDGAPLGIVHHDVSPHNIFVTFAGSVKLLDFGIAWISNFEPTSAQQGLRGRPAYMAPEVIRGERVDARADLFSLGAVLWELLAGARLFSAKTREETFANICRGVVPPLAGAGFAGGETAPAALAGISQEADAVLRRALAVNPQFRFSAALEMRDAVASLLASVRNSRDALSDRRHLELTMRQLFEAERRAAAELLATRMPTLRQRYVDFPVTSPSTPPRSSMYPARIRQS